MKGLNKTILNYRFYRGHKGKWFIDLPGYHGKTDALMMVAGADDFLENLSAGMDEICLTVSEADFIGSESIKLKGITGNDGADYLFDERKIWLCSVTEHIFGYYPKKIFFKIIANL